MCSLGMGTHREGPGMTDKDRDDDADGLLDELRRAAVFLTRLPVERLLGEEPLLSLPPLAEATRAFPAVGAANGTIGGLRSEERRVGKECVSTCSTRWSPSYNKKTNSIKQPQTNSNNQK